LHKLHISVCQPRVSFLLHNRLRSISSKVSQHQSQNFYNLLVSNISQMNRRCSYLELLCLYIPQNCIQHLPATARTNLITAAALCGSETIALLSSTGYTQKLHRLSTQTGAQVAGQAVAFFCSPICSQVLKAKCGTKSELSEYWWKE
jgi:hypothetical protein